MHKQPTARGLRRLSAAWRNSRAGLRDIWHREEAFRLEVGLLVLSVPLALGLGASWGQVGLMVGSVLLLIIVEILNSAIEVVVDRIGPELHELSRIAKDLGSAAVFLTALIPAAIWTMIILNRIGIVSL